VPARQFMHKLQMTAGYSDDDYVFDSPAHHHLRCPCFPVLVPATGKRVIGLFTGKKRFFASLSRSREYFSLIEHKGVVKEW
jgi:hypothetical protein